MWKLRKSLLGDLLVAARNTYPHEFFALLAVKHDKQLIEEFVIIPAVYGETHAIFRGDLIPFDASIVGSVHSHPTPSLFPSRADVHAFARFGRIHLIIAFPFNLTSVKAFNGKGSAVQVRVVD